MLWRQERGPGPSVRGKQSRQLRRMCPPPCCPAGPQWLGTAPPNPCFPPCPPPARGGHPAASVQPPGGPRCPPPKALPIKAATAETRVVEEVGTWRCSLVCLSTSGPSSRQASTCKSGSSPSIRCCRTMPAPLGPLGRAGDQGTRVFNGGGHSSPSSRTPPGAAALCHTLAGAGRGTPHGSIPLRQKGGEAGGTLASRSWLTASCPAAAVGCSRSSCTASQV